MILMFDLSCNHMKFLTEYLTFNVKKRREFVNISDDISLCAHVMFSTGKDPFDVVADFVSSRQGEKTN